MVVKIKSFGDDTECHNLIELQNMLTEKYQNSPVTLVTVSERTGMEKFIFVTPLKEKVIDTYSKKDINLASFF